MQGNFYSGSITESLLTTPISGIPALPSHKIKAPLIGYTDNQRQTTNEEKHTYGRSEERRVGKEC